MEKGADAVATIWKSLTKEQKSKLESHFAICGESAKAYDAQNALEAVTEDNLSKLNELLSKVETLLTPEETADIKRIADNKETASYDKAIKFLTSKIPAND